VGGEERREQAKVLAEQRYRAVLEVRDGQPVSEVAARYGVSRQSVFTWRVRYESEGLDGLKERSRRPHTSPAKVAAAMEAQICELRRQHRRWGARRIVFELFRVGSTGPGGGLLFVLGRNDPVW
jgi:transposase